MHGLLNTQNQYSPILEKIMDLDWIDSMLEIFKTIQNIEVNNITFSDHSTVIMSLAIKEIGNKGNFYWKMNTSLLESEEVKNNFVEFWQHLKGKIYFYVNICEWWEHCAKPHIKKFFIKYGKIENQLKLGRIKYFEIRLKSLYNAFHTGEKLNINEIKGLKNRINELKNEI